MNPVQKQRISELRGEGVTYAAIAIELGVSKNTVKSYCRRNIVSAKKNSCPMCGLVLEHLPQKKQKRFCSDKCRLAWWAKNPEALNRRAIYNFVCLRCKTAFTAYGNAKRKYCSRACSAAARRDCDG